jgi:hypothetical protein
MATQPRDRITILQEDIAQQRATVEALKRDGHEYKDAERQLDLMLADLHIYESAPHRSR